MADLELELTYLAKKIPKQINYLEPRRIVDVYVPEDLSKHARLRIRQNGDKFTITKKVPLSDGDASSQYEHTIHLNQDEFGGIHSCSKRRVVKDRYEIKLAGRTAEIDVFREELEGLVIIDFEFNTEEEKSAFKAPEECLADVTQETFIAGGMLAGKNYSNIKTELNRFKYEKL